MPSADSKMETDSAESALAALSLQNRTVNEPKNIVKRKKKKSKK